MMEIYDVVVIGAGASGLVCAREAGIRDRKVLVLDHGRAGRKILMSGGGRCNFTNRRVTADQYMSSNPHFCKSALSRFTPEDFLDRVRRAGIPYEERDHGQLFCTGKASEILDMLTQGCKKGGVRFALNTGVETIRRSASSAGSSAEAAPRFRIRAGRRSLETASLVIATGGVSIPGAGASPFGFRIAEQFGIAVVPPRPGLVPFTLQPADKKILQPLSGIAVKARVSLRDISFTENLLFTHRGLSGPVILQVSSYWQPGQAVAVDLLPEVDLTRILESERQTGPKKQVKTLLFHHLPKRLVMARLPGKLAVRPVGSLSGEQLAAVSDAFHRWRLKPGGTEGFRTAEVTVGGVDCSRISSKTMESRDVPGLFFIGEVLDVTGWLGGFNLQWAWSSGWAAGQYV